MKKISSLMLLALVFLLSCRTDQFPEKEVYNNTSAFQLTSKRISLNESKHKAKLLPELEQVENMFKTFSKSNAQGKLVNYGEGVSIDTESVIYIENGPNYHTYTFNIIRDNALPTNPVENLVLTPLTDGTYKELLVFYNLTIQEKQILLNGGLVNTKGKTTITELSQGTYTPLSKGMTACGWQETYTMMGCSDVHDGVSTHNSGNTETWGSCTADRKPGLYMTMVYKCDFIFTGNETGGEEYGPGDENTEPCNGNGVATNPTDPNTNIGEGGCSGVVTIPTLSMSFSMIVRSLPSEVKILLNSNTAFYNGLNTYYTANQTPQGENFVRWAAQFSWENQNVTWAQFQNWFMTKSEGQDGEYIANLDDVLNSIQYQTKQMPTYSQFVSAFPKLNYTGYPGYYLKLPAAQVYPIIGGDLENLYNDKKDNGPFRNACAVRWSLGMNGAGILIPNNSVSIKGADVNGQPRYYIVNSEAAGSFMQKTFGNPTHKLEGADANNSNKIANFLKGKTGIYVVTNNNPVDAGYYGHIDLI